MNKNSLRTYLSSSYQGAQSFLEHIIYPIFGEEHFVDEYEAEILTNQPEYESLATAAGIQSIKQVGKVYVGVEPLQVFDITVGSQVQMARNRVGIQQLIRRIMDTHSLAFMLFHYEDGGAESQESWVWRFTFCHKGASQTDTTSSKRFTFLLGPGQHCRTATDNFQRLIDKRGTVEVKDIEDAFSVEALTKQFYKDLFEWYQWAISPEAGISFPNDTNISDYDRDDLATKIIRLITRIMFVWFIKQNGLVPTSLFDVSYLKTILKDFDPQSQTEGKYYNAILQNLFFGTLNRARQDEKGVPRGFATSSKRDIKTSYRYADLFSISEQEVIRLFDPVPFLNGGLFECLDKTRTIDGVEHCYSLDGFSRNDIRLPNGRFKHRATIPNYLFFEPERGLLSILSRYNFTIEENSPEEQQVALDPELLGKVFENLLGAYNPETQETARNRSGSFYTPREVVDYMVDESLIAYLGDNDLVRALFSPDFILRAEHKDEYNAIATKLKEVKILDPACGSGAFPMGLLNRMIEIFGRISPIESSYDLKLYIIENCLYGSDIQSIAAQITKLRFFISLICDCERDETKPNSGIPTLPNLETKFVAANTLIAKKKMTLHGNIFEDPEIEKTKNELIKVRHEHFSARSTSAKQRLRDQDRTLREHLAQLLADNEDFAPEDALQLAAWNPYDQNAVCPFFDPEWMFNLTSGFDIVIGNPPYIQLQNNGGELAKIYQGYGFKGFARTGDIYCLFYERGYQLLREGGHLCYITSNKWMRAGYGEKIRGFLAHNTNPILLVDFAGIKVFEGATVDTNILLFSKEKNEGKTLSVSLTKDVQLGRGELCQYVQQHATPSAFTSSESWVILSPIEQSIKRKIEAVGKPLKDWDIQIYRGVLTGCNEAFIIDEAKRAEILSNCQSDDERERTEAIIRPILRGRDIRRYGYVDSGKYLINTHNGVKEKGIPPIDITDYPAIKEHLDSFGDAVMLRSDQGDTPYNLRNCAYLEDFNKPKIVWGEISDRSKFAYEARGGYMVEATTFLMVGCHLPLLFCMLNSLLLEWLFSKVGTTTGVGTVRWKKYTIEQLTLPLFSETEIEFFARCVASYLDGTLSISEFASNTNQKIYELLELTQDEIDLVENLYLRGCD